MILGIDVSTSITGAAVVDQSGKIIETNYCDLRKYKDFFEKCLHMREFCLDMADKYCAEFNKQGASAIYIEQPFSFFSSGGSSAKTMAALQRFNGVVSWMFYETFEIKPSYIGATQARKKVGIKVPRGKKAKQVVMEHLIENEQDFKVEYTHAGNPRPHFYDMADALIIARAGLITEKEKQFS